jgi:ferredoxin-NADP reductase
MADPLFTPVVVDDIVQETPQVVLLRLVRRGGALGPFEPGSHVEAQLPNGLRRSYSIASDPDDLSHYEIAVLREPESRGGSNYIHDVLDVGDLVLISPPRSGFPIVADAARHVLVAGGIGITPFLSMVHRFRRDRVPFELHYLARSAEDAALLGRLRSLAEVRTYFSADGCRFDPAVLRVQAGEANTQIYCCGPQRLMNDLRTALADRSARIPRFETFAEAPVSPLLKGDPFEVEIASTGVLVPVHSEQTMLEALRQAGCDVPSSCEHGLCGTCVLRYLKGKPLHRDGVLDASARRDRIAPCISRAEGRLVLSL